MHGLKASGGIQISGRTDVYTGSHYTGSDIGGSLTLSAPGDGLVRVVCTNAHGLEVGNEIAITGSNGNNVNGSWVVATVESPTIFEYIQQQHHQDLLVVEHSNYILDHKVIQFTEHLMVVLSSLPTLFQKTNRRSDRPNVTSVISLVRV